MFVQAGGQLRWEVLGSWTPMLLQALVVWTNQGLRAQQTWDCVALCCFIAV
jgi:hypothetical protein